MTDSPEPVSPLATTIANFPDSTTLGIIGRGKMASALLKAFLRTDVIYYDSITYCGSTSTSSKGDQMSIYGAIMLENADKIILSADIVIIAVKPQSFSQLSKSLKLCRPSQTVISVVAGVSIANIKGLCGLETPTIVRFCPTLAAEFSESASAFSHCPSPYVPPIVCKERILALLRGCGSCCIEVPERSLNAVTGMAGSGMGFVLLMMEAMADGGVRVGLTREDAIRLAAQTMLGTAKLALSSQKHTAELRDAVASPGGTTIAGIHELERGGVRGSIITAIKAATDRAGELGESFL